MSVIISIFVYLVDGWEDKLISFLFKEFWIFSSKNYILKIFRKRKTLGIFLFAIAHGFIIDILLHKIKRNLYFLRIILIINILFEYYLLLAEFS